MGRVTVKHRHHVGAQSPPPPAPPRHKLKTPNAYNGMVAKGPFTRPRMLEHNKRRVAPMAVKYRRRARRARRFFAMVDAGLREKNIIDEIARIRGKTNANHPHRVEWAACRLDPADVARSSRMDLLSLEAPDYYSRILRNSRECHIDRQIYLLRKKMSQSQLLRLFCIELASCIRAGEYSDAMWTMIHAIMMVARGYCHLLDIPVLLGRTTKRKRRSRNWNISLRQRIVLAAEDDATQEYFDAYINMLCRKDGPNIMLMFDMLTPSTAEADERSLDVAKRILAGEDVSP